MIIGDEGVIVKLWCIWRTPRQVIGVFIVAEAVGASLGSGGAMTSSVALG